jgi:hypothetical protein
VLLSGPASHRRREHGAQPHNRLSDHGRVRDGGERMSTVRPEGDHLGRTAAEVVRGSRDPDVDSAGFARNSGIGHSRCGSVCGTLGYGGVKVLEGSNGQNSVHVKKRLGGGAIDRDST